MGPNRDDAAPEFDRAAGRRDGAVYFVDKRFSSIKIVVYLLLNTFVRSKFIILKSIR